MKLARRTAGQKYEVSDNGNGHGNGNNAWTLNAAL